MSAKKPDGIGWRIYPAHKPKDGDKVVFYWDGGELDVLAAEELDPGDIWRPFVSPGPPPSQRLIDRAEAIKAKDPEHGIE